MQKIFPNMPPIKYTVRNFFSPSNAHRYLPKKYRVIILARMCPILPWRKRLVIIVQGLSSMLAGINPRSTISVGTIRVTMKSNKFSPIKTHIGVSLIPQ